MKHGDYVRIKPRSGDKRKPLSGWIVAMETNGSNPTITLDEDSCARLGAQSGAVTCSARRLEPFYSEEASNDA